MAVTPTRPSVAKAGRETAISTDIHQPGFPGETTTGAAGVGESGSQARRDVVDPAEGREARTSGARFDGRARQRERFGGLNWGAASFGWLVAIGIAAILTAILSAAGAAIGLTSISSAEAQKHAATIGIGGGIALLIVLLLAYYAGGYVAGRMSRFDGGRQGLGAWVIGLFTTIVFAGAGVAFGSKYNVLGSLNLPRIPIKEGALATGGVIALAAILLGTLIAAIVGGRIGRTYHSKVDRAASRPDEFISDAA
jgi:hypothetical protein